MLIIKNVQKLNKKKIKLFINNYSAGFIYAISYIIYLFSLEGCFKGDDICGNNMKWIHTKLTQIIISSEIIVYLIVRILFYKSPKIHLIHLVIVFLLFYQYSHNYYFYDHGMYNIIVFIFVLIINLFVLLLLKTIIIIFKIKNKINIVLKLFIIIILYIIYNYKIPNFYCDDWVKGLNNTSIDNDDEKYGCKIKTPKYCQYKLFSSIQDYTKILGINCRIAKSNSKKNLLKKTKSDFISKKTKKFGFPYTNKGLIACLDGLDTEILKEFTFTNIFDMEKKHDMFGEPEIIVDFSKDPLGELILDVKYNDTLSKERKKLENKNIPYSNNIIMIYIDSISRACSMRQLNKTLTFFEKFISFKGGFNEKYPDENFHSFQFFKYHSFYGRTVSNYMKLYFGNNREAKNIVRFNKYFKDNGYITSNVCDVCQKDNTRTLHDTTVSELYDHQLLLCDPNKERYHKPTKKCLYGKNDVSYLFSYSELFWRKYKNNRKFSNIIIDGAHESTMEVLKYYDDIIYNYLISLFNDNLFKDTSIILLSDHGAGVQSIYYMFDFYQYESDLPMLYIIINDRKNISYKEQYLNINKNQQTFITAFDIYNTVNHLLYGDKYKFIKNLTDENPTPKSSLGKSLFEYIDQKYRKSKNYEFMNNNICI